jgi:hypothetical protein
VIGSHERPLCGRVAAAAPPRLLCAAAVLCRRGRAAIDDSDRGGSHVCLSSGGVFLEELTDSWAEKALTPETVVVIPLGAQSKEHGPHLKLRTTSSSPNP